MWLLCDMLVMCLCTVAVILLEGGTELDLQTLNPAVEGQQIKRLAGSRMYFSFEFISVVSFGYFGDD